LRRWQSYQSVSREALLSDWGLKPYKPTDSVSSCKIVRLAKISRPFREGGGGGAMARFVAEGFR